MLQLISQIIQHFLNLNPITIAHYKDIIKKNPHILIHVTIQFPAHFTYTSHISYPALKPKARISPTTTRATRSLTHHASISQLAHTARSVSLSLSLSLSLSSSEPVIVLRLCRSIISDYPDRRASPRFASSPQVRARARASFYAALAARE